MDFETLRTTVVEFVKAHQTIAPFLVALLAFGESLAVVSLIVPASMLIFAIGFLIADGALSFLPIWIGGALGAYLGDFVSYLLGFYFKKRIFRVWPLYRFPRMIFTGRKFFKKYGLVSVFIGRFFGPVRAVIPLIAGVFQMPWPIFQIANATSAMLWSLGLLAPGIGLGWLFQW